MYRSGFSPVSSHAHIPRRKDISTPLLLAPLALWICASIIIRYGYYGDCRMALGPNSSRLMTASSVFVQKVEVRDENRKGKGKGTLVYGFSEKPELRKEINWSSSNYLIVGSYGRKGYSLWLNKGSWICIRWSTQATRLDKIEVIMIKGERQPETLLPKLTLPFDALVLNETVMTGKEVEYTIEEDDKYYVGVINSSPRSVVMTFSLNVTSKVYDVTKASNMCSTLNGSCQLQLQFPSTQYVIVSTPDNCDIAGRYIELSFVARVATYIAVLGSFIIIILLALKYLGACDSETTMVNATFQDISRRTDTDPILRQKSVRLTYGTTAEEDDDAETGSSSSSSEDLYDAKLCVICYDEQRNCFFVPCGHCATCYDCAQRIMDEDNKMCPICRRMIHKVRRLFSP